MRLSLHLHRSLAALPLLVLGLLAAGHEAAPAPEPLRLIIADEAGCAEAARPVGARGLARMPGDLAVIGRRISCAAG